MPPCIKREHSGIHMLTEPNYYWHKNAIRREPENAALSPENSFILDAVTVFPSVPLECTAKFTSAGHSSGLHINTCLETNCPLPNGRINSAVRLWRAALNVMDQLFDCHHQIVYTSPHFSVRGAHFILCSAKYWLGQLQDNGVCWDSVSSRGGGRREQMGNVLQS